ncbi:FtsW/RodA/SpoVE family cell cycle protein [Campylobacter canadensis]|uniref:FtsW/RodA/SpoVE family cell cycle protein n=1 Tax=Campylobacter canadensis TaxID=449520 RepID=UPI001CCD6FF1|nr:FtsW/RodA/SpoVE family cell cycle protein [Campylobacter canadensis]MBZ7994584.1 rod shape-determining protein RodA [Campylobacter canadensis]
MIRLDGKIFTHFDFILPFLVFPIIAFSFLLINEANEILSHKQILYIIVGFFAFFIFFLLPIRKFLWLIPFFYWFCILLLLLVDLIGTTKLGAQRWLEIPFTPFTIQSSEIFKPAFLLMLAYQIKLNPPPKEGYGLKMFIKLSFFILLPFVLIKSEPDLGSALIILIVGYATLFLIGVNYKIWLGIFISLAIALPVIYESLHSYQKKRINDFLSKEPSYQVKQSIIAIGSGGLNGKSKTQATQTHFKFLPISTSDFIFAYTIERYGFFGACALLFTYLLLIMHLLSINQKLKKDFFSRTFICALAFLIFIYVGVNVSMTIGFAPVVGVPLPFFSYGGSSFVTFMVLFGIYENLLAFRFDPNYKLIRINFN